MAAMAKAKIVPIILAVLFILPISSAWWSESIDVYVVDNLGRAVPNSTVTVIYQLSACDKHGQVTNMTDASGKAHLEFMNTVYEGEVVGGGCVERSYTLSASYLGAMNSTTGTVGKSPSYNIFLPVVLYSLSIKGAEKITLPVTSVRIGDFVFHSDASGTVRFFVPTGRAIQIIAIYGNVSKALEIKVSDDTSFTLELPVYNLRIGLYDENGRRIAGMIRIGGLSANATDISDARFDLFPYQDAQLEIITGNISHVINLSITSPSQKVYVDLSAPSIREVSVTKVAAGDAKISATVTDSGEFASGLTTNPIVKYSIVGTWGFEDVKMFPSGANTFEALIPADGNDFSYTISAIDNQGNENSFSGNYSFGGAKAAATGGFQITVPHIIGLVIFIVIVVLIYRKIREEMG